MSFPSAHSPMVLFLTFCAEGLGLQGKTPGAVKQRVGSHIPLYYHPNLTTGSMQAEVISWEIWGIATIVLSVPDSHKTQNLSTGETLPQVLSTEVEKLRDLDGSVLPRIQKLVKQDCPGQFLVRVSLTFQPI